MFNKKYIEIGIDIGKSIVKNLVKNTVHFYNNIKSCSKNLLNKLFVLMQKTYKNIICKINKIKAKNIKINNIKIKSINISNIKAAGIKAVKAISNINLKEKLIYLKEKSIYLKEKFTEKLAHFKNLISKEYFSKKLNPKFLKNRKTSGFSTFYWYVSALVIAALLTVSSFTAIIADAFVENKHLKENLNVLNKVNEKQRDLLLQKNSEIKTLKDKESEIDSKIQEFVDRYKFLTESIMQGGISDAPISRSGDSSGRSLLDELSRLRTIINDINNLAGTQDGTKANIENELSEAEQKFYSYLETIPTLWPVTGKITSYFGDREHPIWNTTKLHQGLDISAGYGHDIVAAGDGVVVLSSYYNQYGYTIIIDHGGGMSTLYAHCSSLIAANGQAVKKGEVIAKVGSTGLSTGNHLHFEVRINGIPVDPLNFLN